MKTISYTENWITAYCHVVDDCPKEMLDIPMEELKYKVKNRTTSKNEKFEREEKEYELIMEELKCHLWTMIVETFERNNCEYLYGFILSGETTPVLTPNENSLVSKLHEWVPYNLVVRYKEIFNK